MALGRSTAPAPSARWAGGCPARQTQRRRGGRLYPVLGSLALAIGYSCVVGWIFRYFALSLDGGLFAMGQNMNVIVDRFNGTACGWGNNFWLVIALAVNFAIMAFGVGGGIERANKVMMPVLFLSLCGTGRLHCDAARRGRRLPLHLYPSTRGPCRPEAVDLRLRAGVLLALRGGKRHR